MQSQACLSYAEAHLIFYKYIEFVFTLISIYQIQKHSSLFIKNSPNLKKERATGEIPVSQTNLTCCMRNESTFYISSTLLGNNNPHN